MSIKNISWAPLSASSSRAKPGEVRLSIHAARTDTHGSNAAPRLDIAISNDIAELLGLYAPGSSEARHAAVYCADGMLLVCRREDGLRITGQTPQAVYKVGRRSSRSPNSARCFATALPSFCIMEPRRASMAEHRIEDGALIVQVPKEFLLASVASVALGPAPVPLPAMEEHQPTGRLPLPFDSTRIPDVPGLIVLDLDMTSAESVSAVSEIPDASGTATPEPELPDLLENGTAAASQPGTAPAPFLPAAATRVLKVITDRAAAGKPCPTNRELSDLADCTEQDATRSLATLDAAGLIRRTFVDKAGQEFEDFIKGRGRIVEIVSTGQKTANPFAVSPTPDKPPGGGASAPKPVVTESVQAPPARPAANTIAPPRQTKPAQVSKPGGRSADLSDAEQEALEIVRAARAKSTAVHGQSAVDAAITYLRTIRHVVRPDGAGGYRIDDKPKTGDELVEFANQRRASRSLPPFGGADATAGRAA